MAYYGTDDVVVIMDTTGGTTLNISQSVLEINGVDVEPQWEPCADCTPRCRLYLTADGLRGLPERRWIADALAAASG